MPSPSIADPEPPTRAATPRETIVVVGNGMVGHRFCERLRQTRTAEDTRLIVIGEEPRPAYDRVNLTKYLTQKPRPDLQLATREWYIRNGIYLLTGDPVARIVRDKRQVQTASGLRLPYDKLVLATGSRPFVPPLEGVELPGVYLYRTIEDVEAISQAAANRKSAAVLGGGLLGLEAAEALHSLGLKTHVIEMAPSLMPRQLDRDGGIKLQEAVEEMGVSVHVLTRTRCISQQPTATDGSHQPLKLEFASHQPLIVDMVVVSAGIRARDELARDCELPCGERGGVSVDQQLRTADRAIFAIGECAAHRDNEDFIYGLAGPGYQMADVLVANLSGGDERFQAGDLSSRLKLLSIDVATLGEPLGDAVGVSVVAGDEPGVYRKLLVRNRQIAGAMSVGKWGEVEQVRQAIESRRKIWPWNLRRFQRTGRLWRGEGLPVTEWPAQATVCSCTGRTRGELTAAIESGCTTVDALAQCTGASSVCGSCKPLLATLVGKPATEPAGYAGRLLLAASVAAALLTLIAIFAPPFPFASSVTSTWRQVDILYRDGFLRQVTGYTLLATAVAAAGLSLRKRLNLFSFTAYTWWRAVHTTIGAAAVFGMLAHTGISLGSNLNFVLGSTFITTSVLGAATGILSATEHKLTGDLGMFVRTWRPRLAWLHIVLLWPLPVLLIYHIFSAYYY